MILLYNLHTQYNANNNKTKSFYNKITKPLVITLGLIKFDVYLLIPKNLVLDVSRINDKGFSNNK